MCTRYGHQKVKLNRKNIYYSYIENAISIFFYSFLWSRTKYYYYIVCFFFLLFHFLSADSVQLSWVPLYPFQNNTIRKGGTFDTCFRSVFFFRFYFENDFYCINWWWCAAVTINTLHFQKKIFIFFFCFGFGGNKQ